MPWLILALLAIVFLYAWFVEPARLEIRSELVGVAPSKLKKPVRLLFLSDFHASPLVSAWIWKRNLAALCRRHAENPFDAVLLGGDYVDRSPRFLYQAERLVAALAEWGVPLYAVLGNHDYRAFGSRTDELRQRLERIGAQVLVNGSAVLKVRGEQVQIIGLDDLQSTRDYWVRGKRSSASEFRARAKRLGWYEAFDGQGADLPRVLVGHNPDSVYLPGRQPDLVVCGHTHGGQYAPLVSLAPLTRAFLNPKGSFGSWAGRQIVEGRTLLVSRGFGGSWLPARFLRRPDVLDITLQPISSSAAMNS